MKRLFLIALACACLALTPAERKIVEHAKAQLEGAQTELKQAQDYAQWADKSQADAWTFAGQTDAAAKKTGQEIETAHKHEQDQAAYIAKIEPVYKAVTRWWGLGAFVWGIEELLKHLLILALFGTGLMLAFWGLTFVFPFLLPAFHLVVAFFHRILASIESRITKR